VIDMVMPEMDGLTLSESLREIPQAKKMPVILLTSGGMEDIDPARRQVGFFSTIAKPWKSTALRRELLRVLAPQPEPVSATAAPAALPAEIPGSVEPEPEPQPEAGVAPDELPSFRILVVEDNLVHQQVVLTVLQALGYAPDMAETGQRGIEMAEVGGYDLILLDVQLPDIDGWAVARHLRQYVRDKRLTIVAITAGVTPDERQACFDAGMDDFVMKPFRISTLKDVIVKYARNEPQEPAPEPPVAAVPAERTVLINGVDPGEY